MELVKTHTFMRKQATGKTKIELRILHMERGISWEVVKDKWGIWSGPIRRGLYLGDVTSPLPRSNLGKLMKNIWTGNICI